MLSQLIKLPILKRLIPSLYKKYIFLFYKWKKTIFVDGIYYNLVSDNQFNKTYYFFLILL